jgi:hypothetical protein
VIKPPQQWVLRPRRLVHATDNRGPRSSRCIPYRPSISQLFTQLADEYVNDLLLRFIHTAVQVVEEHFLRQRHALTQTQQLKHLVLFDGKIDPLGTHFDGLGIKIYCEIAGPDYGLRVALAATDDGMDAGD